MKRTMLFLLLLFPIIAVAQPIEQNGNELIFNGNRFTLHDFGIRDTIIITDPVTGDSILKTFALSPRPVAMNGEKIYDLEEVTVPPRNFANDTALQGYILSGFTTDNNLRSLQDGILRIDLRDIVVDTAGKVVYYEYTGALFKGEDQLNRSVNLSPEKIDSLLTNAPSVKPATLHGAKVITRTVKSMCIYKLEIHNHTITYKKNGIYRM